MGYDRSLASQEIGGGGDYGTCRNYQHTTQKSSAPTSAPSRPIKVSTVLKDGLQAAKNLIPQFAGKHQSLD